MKKIIILALFLVSQSAFSTRIKWLDRISISINPEAQIEGPVYVNNIESRLSSDYGNELFKIILQEAHFKANKYLTYGDISAYSAFMALALTVPLHEGLYIHFRKVENVQSNCSDKNNTGSKLKSKTSKKHFRKAFNEGESPFLSSCSELSNEEHLRQMLSGGYDGADIGVMQVNVRWHYDKYLAKKKFLSVRESVSYGLDLLYDGFRRIYANYDLYDCLTRDKNDLYENLVRGTWAGKYNSGNLLKKSVCRFDNSNSPYKKHDIGFLENLEKITGFKQKGFLGHNSEMRMGLNKENKEALAQIISNLESTQSQGIDRIQKVIVDTESPIIKKKPEVKSSPAPKQKNDQKAPQKVNKKVVVEKKQAPKKVEAKNIPQKKPITDKAKEQSSAKKVEKRSIPRRQNINRGAGTPLQQMKSSHSRIRAKIQPVAREVDRKVVNETQEQRIVEDKREDETLNEDLEEEVERSSESKKGGLSFGIMGFLKKHFKR